MADSIQPIKRPKDFEKYTDFMMRCTIAGQQTFNQDGSKKTFGESFSECRVSWDKAKEMPNSIGSPIVFEDESTLMETEDGVFMLTEGLEFMNIEGV